MGKSKLTLKNSVKVLLEPKSTRTYAADSMIELNMNLMNLSTIEFNMN